MNTQNKKTMITIERIYELQKEYGLDKAQSLINSGQIWGFEGSVGRTVMDALEAGLLMLGENRTSDYYGSTIPTRTELKDGTKGTLGNSQRFWGLVEDGDDGATEYAEQYRNFMNYGFVGAE